MDRRFLTTLGIYVVLALLATFTLTGTIRIATLIFLAGIALKTWLVVLKRKLD